jgi:hypothetical protein
MIESREKEKENNGMILQTGGREHERRKEPNVLKRTMNFTGHKKDSRFSWFRRIHSRPCETW